MPPNTSPPNLVPLQQMIGSILTLQQNRPRRQTNQRMPTIFLHIKHPQISIGVKGNTLCLFPVVIIKNPLNLSSQYYNRLRTGMMPMNLHNRTRLKSIKHPLRQVFRTITQIHGLSQARIFFSLFCQTIQYRIINYHILKSRFVFAFVAHPSSRVLRTNLYPFNPPKYVGSVTNHLFR